MNTGHYPSSDDSRDPPNVILICPPYERRPTSGITPPLGLCYLAGSLRASGADPAIVDLASLFPGFELSKASKFEHYARKTFSQMNLDSVKLVGIGPLVSANLESAQKAIHAVRMEAPNAHITVGGPQTVAPGFEKVAAEFFNADSYIVGEGEWPIAFLWKALIGNQELENAKIPGLAFPNRPSISPYKSVDLSDLPLPTRDLLSNDRYTLSCRRRTSNVPSTTAVLSRGCPFSCIFCAAPILTGKKVKRIPSPMIIEDLNKCAELGLKNIVFYDDCFFINSSSLERQIMDFVKAIESSRWEGEFQLELRCDTVCAASNSALMMLEKSGCSQINMGIEKGTAKALTLFRKHSTLSKIHNACEKLALTGMRTAGTFILGGPGETETDLEDTIAFAVSLPLDFAQFNPLAIIPGTSLYNMLFPDQAQNDWFKLSLDRAISPKGDILWQNSKLDLPTIASKIALAYSRFYSNERLRDKFHKYTKRISINDDELAEIYDRLRTERGTYLLEAVENFPKRH